MLVTRAAAVAWPALQKRSFSTDLPSPFRALFHSVIQTNQTPPGLRARLGPARVLNRSSAAFPPVAGAAVEVCKMMMGFRNASPAITVMN